MNRVASWVGQALLYGLFALTIGVFANWPLYHPLPEQTALIKISFIHHGQRVAECRAFTPQELAKLAPNMRTPMKCERERSPVIVEVDLDGASVYRKVAAPSGLSRDGPSSVYQRLEVPAGEHRIAVRLKDNAGKAAFNYTREVTVKLAPSQILVIDFDAQKGEISLS